MILKDVIYPQGDNGRHDVSDLVYLPVHTQQDVHQMMGTAEGNRTIARTDMNERSSRRWVRAHTAPTRAHKHTHARTHAHTHTHTQTNKQTHAHSGMHGLGQFSMSRERGLSRPLGWSQHRQLILTSTFARPRQPHDLLPADLGVAVHRRADPDPARDPAPRRPGRIRARRQVRRHRRANERGAVY